MCIRLCNLVSFACLWLCKYFFFLLLFCLRILAKMTTRDDGQLTRFNVFSFAFWFLVFLQKCAHKFSLFTYPTICSYRKIKHIKHALRLSWEEIPFKNAIICNEWKSRKNAEIPMEMMFCFRVVKIITFEAYPCVLTHHIYAFFVVLIQPYTALSMQKTIFKTKKLNGNHKVIHSFFFGLKTGEKLARNRN